MDVLLEKGTFSPLPAHPCVLDPPRPARLPASIVLLHVIYWPQRWQSFWRNPTKDLLCSHHSKLPRLLKSSRDQQQLRFEEVQGAPSTENTVALMVPGYLCARDGEGGADKGRVAEQTGTEKP